MASPAVTYTFSNSTTADAGQVNTNFSDLISGMTDGTKDFSIAALTLAGALTANGNCTFGNATSDTVTYTARIASTFVPSTTATYDQGTSSLGWASMYFGRNSQTVRVIPSASTAASYTFTLPLNVGTTGYALVDSDGAATTAWQPLHGPDAVINASLACSVATSALTISLKDAGGSDASSTSPIRIAFRSATAATGTYTMRSVTSSLSVVVSSGSTLGHTNSTESPIYVYAIDNAGTVELAVSTALYDTFSIVSTTAEGGAGAADSATAIYSTTARSNVGIRLIGRLLSTQTTAGTWAAVPTEAAPGTHFGTATVAKDGFRKKNRYVQRTAIQNGANRTFAGNGSGATSSDLVAAKFDNISTSKRYRLSWAFEVENKTAAAIQIDVSLKVSDNQTNALALSSPNVRLQSILTNATSGGVWGLAGSYVFTPGNTCAIVVLNTGNQVQVNPTNTAYNNVSLEEVDDEVSTTTIWD